MFPIEATNGLRPMSPSHLIHKFAGCRQQGQCQQGLGTETPFFASTKSRTSRVNEIILRY